jgi:hypothetical protein
MRAAPLVDSKAAQTVVEMVLRKAAPTVVNSAARTGELKADYWVECWAALKDATMVAARAVSSVALTAVWMVVNSAARTADMTAEWMVGN